MRKARRNPKITTGPTKQGHSATTTSQVNRCIFELAERALNFALTLAGYVATVATKNHAGVGAGNFSDTPSKSCGRIHTKAKAPARKNVLGIAVAAPTDKRGLVMPEISRHGFAHIGVVVGHGVGYPQGCPHGYSHVLNRHAHPLRVRTQPVVLKSRIGAKTMSVSVSKGHPAPTSKAAPANSPIDPIALHGEAVNALAMAKFYAKRHNHLGAKRKAVQALSALRQLAAFERVEACHAV